MFVLDPLVLSFYSAFPNTTMYCGSSSKMGNRGGVHLTETTGLRMV